ncbi:MAG: hypothetical protein ACE5IO_05825 [Thermoplasmata archaeon]
MSENRGSYEGYVIPDKRDTPEARILRRFVNSNNPKGLFVEEFVLSSGEVADAICIETPSEDYAHIKGPVNLKASAEKYTLNTLARGKEGDTIWVIEVKDKGDLKHALGQVLVYAFLFRKGYPKYDVKKAILCTEGRKDIEDLCKSLDIDVFIV